MASILITGASSGIGKQLAIDYAKDGFDVIACGRDKQRLQVLQNTDPRITTLSFDVNDQTGIHHALGSLDTIPDLIILNAGNCEYINQGFIDIELIHRAMNCNFFGVINLLESLQVRLKKNTHIGIVSSSVTFLPLPRAEAYGASKAALDYFINSLAIDWKDKGVSFSIISPGFVKTPLTDKNTFSMPMMVNVETASNIIRKGLKLRKPHIVFPKRFTFLLKLLANLPTHWQIRLFKQTAEGSS